VSLKRLLAIKPHGVAASFGGKSGFKLVINLIAAFVLKV